MAGAALYRDHVLAGLDQLAVEIDAHQDDAAVWTNVPGIANCAGTLTLHLVGNLQHFIGAQLGSTGYVREREREFTMRDVPREQLLAMIADTRAVVHETLTALPAAVLDQAYPLTTFGEGRSVEDVLIILVEHFRYHLGQINYLRRIVGATGHGS
jgi:hypothetical protein